MVRVRTEALHSTRLQIVRKLGQAAEYRDNETGMHIIRMSKIAARIAQSAGWDIDACDLMLNASPMHDIGKIGIPDAILLKPENLSQQSGRS
ncbi:HD-GYP domain-containing protein [Paludibacterium denitrificans]|uniref:HD-GYP domain-containing protein n=1 Tax=Paludibacterium denitrificans TaxID=2675226 RepID=UPI001E57A633|nr:HD domain-containing protein [Paludibacterium denitrificans]